MDANLNRLEELRESLEDELRAEVDRLRAIRDAARAYVVAVISEDPAEVTTPAFGALVRAVYEDTTDGLAGSETEPRGGER